jgi:hypothetical protein
MVESLVVTFDMYRRALARGAVLAMRNWPVLLSVFAYAGMMAVGAYLAMFLGLVGGFLMAVLSAACASSFLYLVEMIVRTNKVTWEDFRHSFGPYLLDVMGVLFVFWIFNQFLAPALLQLPQGPVVVLSVELVGLVLFNAVPELIYLGHYPLVALLARSYEFIASNWIEWFPPNLLLAAGFVALSAPEPSSTAGVVAQSAALALFVYFAMVVRGLLFIELDGTTRRARIFRHKMGR